MHLPTRLARVHARDLRLHFLSLTADDRRLRFGRSMNDAALGAYVDRIDFARDALFGVFDADLVLIGVAHLARGTDRAELGLSVLPAGRRGGIAASLLDRAITHARACGITLLTLHCMSENEPMRRLAQRARMTVAREHGELQAELQLAPATGGTALADWVEQGMATAHHAWRAQLAGARGAAGARSVDRTPTDVDAVDRREPEREPG
ncbi:MAG: GNAT family N-acetyltransferase [Burkholderiaceae bacterium]|nr:GNAT family N-acetyltransferase [Burkholderiaceae bacterium]